MSSRTTRLFFSTLAAIILVFVADGLIILYANLPSMTKQESYNISFQNATVIAQDNEPTATVIGAPTLITYAGTPAYEVMLDRGMIYVEANTGRVLANTARGPISCEQSMATTN
ncbi:hypothetical protein EKD04_007235 [Chloroflexales bacterium ZM16-3]|nr:hypothetical protein [Chloroflexales bacterium ZM16-3]